MYSRILVPLDGSDYSRVATKYAIKIAAQNNSPVIGIGVIDKEEIEDSTMGAGIGSSYYADHLGKFKLNQAISKIKNFLNEFKESCEEAGVEYEIHSKSGVPFEQIVHLGKTSDLIICGLKTFFHFETTPESGETLRELLESSVAPVMAVPKTRKKESGHILVAYDGSVHASKAFKSFATQIQTVAKIDTIHILNVNKDYEKAQKIVEEAAHYFKGHGFDKIEKTIKVGESRVEILKYAKEIDSDLTIMGAYGENGLSKIFFGRSSKAFIEDESLPVYVYH